jgi:hypothetical protein
MQYLLTFLLFFDIKVRGNVESRCFRDWVCYRRHLEPLTVWLIDSSVVPALRTFYSAIPFTQFGLVRHLLRYAALWETTHHALQWFSETSLSLSPVVFFRTTIRTSQQQLKISSKQSLDKRHCRTVSKWSQITKTCEWVLTVTKLQKNQEIDLIYWIHN